MTRKKSITLIILVLCTMLWMYSGYFLLVCPLHWLTGLQCPLCGTQRAVSALLHLHPVDAFWYNPWLIVLVPYGIALVLSSFCSKVKGLPFFIWCRKNGTELTVCVLTILWGIVRNIINI